DCNKLEGLKVKLQWARAFGTAHDRL
nr:extracellular hemoglobin chain d2 {N-terminal} [Lumbricus terrestris, Peptide Partial, 25 aa] [Lumbricus terrestris]